MEMRTWTCREEKIHTTINNPPTPNPPPQDIHRCNILHSSLVSVLPVTDLSLQTGYQAVSSSTALDPRWLETSEEQAWHNTSRLNWRHPPENRTPIGRTYNDSHLGSIKWSLDKEAWITDQGNLGKLLFSFQRSSCKCARDSCRIVRSSWFHALRIWSKGPEMK